MADVDAIRRTHESDELVSDGPFPNKQVAVLMFKQAHYHRGLLLAEVERLQAEVEDLKARLIAVAEIA